MPGIKKRAAPKGPQFAPYFHAVANVVVADDVLLGVIVLAHDGQFLHVEPRPLEFFDARFCLDVRVEDPYYCITLSHELPPYGFG
jgi:hypothetical protein